MISARIVIIAQVNSLMIKLTNNNYTLYKLKYKRKHIQSDWIFSIGSCVLGLPKEKKLRLNKKTWKP